VGRDRDRVSRGDVQRCWGAPRRCVLQTLTQRHGTPTVLAALRHLSIRLRAAPDTASTAPPIDAARATLTEAEEAWLDARERRVALSAEIEWLSGRLDAAVAALARDAIVLVAGNRGDVRYRRLFPVAPSQLRAANGDDGARRYVRAVLGVVREDRELTALVAHADPMQAALDVLEGALAHRDEARVIELRASTERGAALDAARRAYNQTSPMLELLLPDDPGRVESCFKDLNGAPAATGEAAAK